jgi:hypothetical protein
MSFTSPLQQQFLSILFSVWVFFNILLLAPLLVVILHALSILGIITLGILQYVVSLVYFVCWIYTSLSLSKGISLVNLANILKCFCINPFLLIGQLSVFSTDVFKSFSYLIAHSQIISDPLFAR